MSKSLTKVKIIGATTCFLVLFFTINFWSDISQKIINRQQGSLSQELTIGNAIQIEQLLKNATTTSSILEAQLELHPKDINNLAGLANVIVKNYQEVEQIRLSPNDITTHVFPEKFAVKYIGKTIVPPLYHQQLSNQLTTFYSAPQLINNTYIIKCHIPVSINNRHWGYISYHLNLDVIIKQSHLMNLDDTIYSYQLIHLGDYNKSTILAESLVPQQNDFYSAAIRIPNNQWYLKLSVNTQSNNPLFFINFVFSVMLASVFTLIGYLGVSEPSRLRHNMKQLTQRYEYQQLILNLILDNVNDEIYVSDRNGKIYLNSSNTHNNKHIPANILLGNVNGSCEDNLMFEQDGKTPINPSEHPLNRSLFNNENIVKQVILSPAEEDSYTLELRSQPIFDTLNNNVGALCIGQRINTKKDHIDSHTRQDVILDMLAHDKPIKHILEHIIIEIQKKLEGVMAAITLINPKTKKISDVISIDLPKFYLDSLIGLSVQDRLMSNCSAMYHDKLVIVEDINIHPFWVNYKDLAEQSKLRSCWSQPIHDASHNVLGTIDIYSCEVNKTSSAALVILKEAAALCSLTLERHKDSHLLHKISLAVQHSSNAVIITNSEGIIEYANPHYNKVTGFKPIEILGTLITVFDHNITSSHIINDINQHLTAHKKWHGELKCYTKERGEFWAMINVTPILSDNKKLSHLVFVLEDITQINQNFSQIDYHNSHDPLTNLYNRQAFEHRLQFLLTKVQEDLRAHSLCSINIDQYNFLDQKFGYQASDELLRQVSQLLCQQLRRRDTLARLGNDQFVVLMEDCDSVNAMNTAKELTTKVTEFKFNWSSQTFDISLSVGVCEITPQSLSIQQVLRQADMACNSAKLLMEQTVVIYKENLKQQPLTGDMFWADQITTAFEHKQFQLYVQPIIAINQPATQRYEVLLKLKDDIGNLVNPDIFLPAAARYNLSIDIDKWVIEETINWSLNNPHLMNDIDKICINLSADALIDESFTLYLIELAVENPNFFNHLIFEFSEYHLLRNLSHSKRFIHALNDCGCQFSIDNFGHGLSSFGHLRDLPINNIKIDGDLIKAIIDDPIACATLQSILHLSQAMNIDIVATQVENNDIANKLREYNINYVQGFLLGKPFLLKTMR
jgi:diguanylate cyclase (GGDEF)-like protein/PAS domain S-box-containing protein